MQCHPDSAYYCVITQVRHDILAICIFKEHLFKFTFLQLVIIQDPTNTQLGFYLHRYHINTFKYHKTMNKTLIKNIFYTFIHIIIQQDGPGRGKENPPITNIPFSAFEMAFNTFPLLAWHFTKCHLEKSPTKKLGSGEIGQVPYRYRTVADRHHCRQ